MSVSPGVHVGVYQITERLGAGGMGEVYRARDTRLGRHVAVKVLPASVAFDADRRARLEREARVLAGLNHPNIATLYGVEDSPAGMALVMELVEGETLTDRIALAGPTALRVRDALVIAEQVAAALEAAHDHGIIHRDLKPANVVVRPDGTVKVLDFGLAKALASVDDATATTVTVTQDSPGIVGPGTPAYMSPEQARGLPVDKRADIWAFGCVLYELLTRQRPFKGERISEVLAKILEREPDFNALPPDTPSAIRRLLRRCLEKDPRQRLRDIGDARFDIKDALTAETAAPRPHRKTVSRRVAAWSVAAALTIAATIWSLGPFTSTTGRSGDPVRLTILLPPGVSVARGPAIGSSVAVSPDGRTVVIAAADKDGLRLYRRPLDRLETTPLAGTERGSTPVFSWDGTSIAFLADGRLKRVPATGGVPIDIAAVPGPTAGMSWGPDDRIVYAYGASGETYAVSAGGGKPQRVTQMGAFSPDALDDGRHVLLQLDGSIQVYDSTSGRAAPLTFQGEPLRGATPRHAGHHLILARDAALLAAPLDLARQEVRGSLVSVLDGVARDAGPAQSTRHFAVSRAGTLAYVAAPSAYELVTIRSDGTERVLATGERTVTNPQFSPDGRFVIAAQARGARNAEDLWLHDLTNGGATRLTFDGGRAPVWTPDGRSFTYSHLGKDGGVYLKPADGSVEARRILPIDVFHWLVGWSPDGRTLAYAVMEGTPGSVMAVTDGKSRRVVGPASIWGGRLSDDGRWLVYYSRDSGNFEIYVTSFPDGRGRWLIAEGTDPTWGPGAKEIYYRSGTRLMAAQLDTESGFRVASRRVVIDPFLPPSYDDYDIHPDGRTIVMVRPSGPTQPREVHVVVNWFAELQRLTGVRD